MKFPTLGAASVAATLSFAAAPSAGEQATTTRTEIIIRPPAEATRHRRVVSTQRTNGTRSDRDRAVHGVPRLQAWICQSPTGETLPHGARLLLSALDRSARLAHMR
ncbi:MAG: hypothetical protein ACKVOB_12550 [Sphingomonas sp.]